MKAINYYIIVDKEKVNTKNIGGLVLTEDLDEDNRYIRAKIISVGNLVEGLKNGDIIYYDTHAGHGISLKDMFYQVIRAQDVVLVE